MQENYYPNVDWDSIYNAIFYQRPLKPQQKGYCLYLNSQERTYKAMPCSQKLRILQDLRNLAYYDANKEKHNINDNQDRVLYELF